MSATETPRPSSPTREAGLTLVEAVLAVLLLASAIIGIATLYAGSEKSARGGRLQAEAESLAASMAEQIRSNPDPRVNFETRIGMTCDGGRSKQNEIERAVACWQQEVATKLTNGTSHISLDSDTVPQQYVIVVSWSEPRTGTASYVLRVRRMPPEKQQ